METNPSIACGLIIGNLVNGQLTEAEAREQLTALGVPTDRQGQMIALAKGETDLIEITDTPNP